MDFSTISEDLFAVHNFLCHRITISTKSKEISALVDSLIKLTDYIIDKHEYLPMPIKKENNK